MEVFDAKQWAIRLALGVAIEKRETLHTQGLETVEVFSEWQAAIRRTPNLELGPR
jgi:hypothetical protein